MPLSGHTGEMPSSPPLTATCLEYLALSAAAPMMANAVITAQLHAAGGKAQEFARVLDLNQRFGGLRLPAPDPRPSIFCTIGVPPHTRIDVSPGASIPFFDFGVAAPCGVDILQTGAVVADFSNDLPLVDVADSFEIFLEGLAREWHGWRRFETTDGRELSGSVTDVRPSLTFPGYVAEASDRWTSWWQTDDYLARLSTMWDYQRTVQFVVWHSGALPDAFDRLLAD